jgi:hypothetical protein
MTRLLVVVALVALALPASTREAGRTVDLLVTADRVFDGAG